MRWKFSSSANLPAIQKCCNQHCTSKTEASARCTVILKYLQKDEIFVVRRCAGEPKRNQMVSTWSFSELNRVVLNSRKNLKTLKDSTYILKVEDDNSHFFHSFIFIFANNAKIHDRLLYWAPLTYKTKNKHTLHSMIHTNTFFLKSGWGVTSLEFIFSRFCFGFVIGCNISLEILGSKGFNFLIIISSLTWKVKFCIIKNQSIFLLIINERVRLPLK